jgi:hypothetical protein
MTKARTLADNFAADINGITAGTGITGGGTSGTVTVTNSMATEIDAKGDLVVGTGADTFSRLAVASTAGYLLSVDSVETTGLKWVEPAAGGGMTLINTGGTTLSGASVTISSIPTTYNDLKIIIRGVRPATDGTDIQMRFNGDSATRYRRINGFSSTSGIFDDTSMKICDDTDNGVDVGFITMEISDYANTSTWKSFIGYATSANHNTPANGDVDFYLGLYNQTAAITSLTFFPGSGNWTSGTVFVYGVK